MSQSTPAANPDQALLPVKQRRTLMWALMIVSVCQFLDMTIANVAVPHMKTSLGASSDSITWVLTSFIIAGAVITPMIGWLADRVGSRRLYLGACVVFIASSALCGAATSLIEMVIFRAVQGSAAAIMGPLSQTIMYDINPPSKQAGAITLWSAVAMIAPVAGPFIGGVLTDSLNWRWVFYINLPLGVPALMVCWALLPSRPLMRRELDLTGFLMIAFGLGVLQLMLDRGEQVDWFNSWETVIELSLALAGLWMFAVHSYDTKKPLFNPALFRNRNFLAGMVFMTAAGLSNIALAALLPSMYQSVFGYTVLATGMLVAPRGLGTVISMMASRMMISRIDFRVLVSAGFLTLSFTMWLMTRWTLDMGREPIIIASFIQGFALGLVFTPVNLMAFGTLGSEMRTDGSSLLNLVRNLGGSFGISYLVASVAQSTQENHAVMGESVKGDMLAGSYDLGTISSMAGDAGSMVMAMADAEVSRQAAMLAYINAFHVLALVMLFIAPLPFLLRKSGAPVFAGGKTPAAAEAH